MVQPSHPYTFFPQKSHLHKILPSLVLYFCFVLVPISTYFSISFIFSPKYFLCFDSSCFISLYWLHLFFLIPYLLFELVHFSSSFIICFFICSLITRPNIQSKFPLFHYNIFSTHILYLPSCIFSILLVPYILNTFNCSYYSYFSLIIHLFKNHYWHMITKVHHLHQGSLLEWYNSTAFDNYTISYIHHCSIKQSNFTALSILYTSSILCPLTTGNQWCYHCILNFAFYRMSCSWNHSVHRFLRLPSFI